VPVVLAQAMDMTILEMASVLPLLIGSIALDNTLPVPPIVFYLSYVGHILALFVVFRVVYAISELRLFREGE